MMILHKLFQNNNLLLSATAYVYPDNPAVRRLRAITSANYADNS